MRHILHIKSFLLTIFSIYLLNLLPISPLSAATTTLINSGSTWSYLDNGSNLGDTWRGSTFNDTGWKTGPAQFGYGDGDEATVLSFGSNSSAKYITTYFRKKFNISSLSSYTSLKLRLLRDDGAVIYLNGQEVYRNNMPTGAIGYTTLAITALGAPDESTFLETSLPISNLLPGDNWIAVELHQANGTSSDISFELELIATDTLSVTRGPYLQNLSLGSTANSSSLKLRWRTDAPSDSNVHYGTDPSNLTLNTTDATLTTEHEVTLNYLSSGTKYYYSIGSTQSVLKSGSDFYFVTPPASHQTKSVKVWVLGDSGTADANARAVRDAYLSYNGTNSTDLVLMLGDNAYQNGTDTEYQAAVFDMYPTILQNSILWPTLGNHDTAQSASINDSQLPYFQMFSLPKTGEAGGLASGTERYYSFNYANIHFVCLDSMVSNRSSGGAMLSWLENDLAANTQPWTIAFWHHPPYSKGSHDSDVETNLIEMRQNALPILENYGVDLILSGHSHSYERSYFIDGHYGSSSSFTSAMKKNSGSGRTDGSGAYRKATYTRGSHDGAVYAVAGSSGKASGGSLNHPAMYISLNQLGSMILDINGNRLEAKFLNNSGGVSDYFTLIKAANQPPSITLSAPTSGETTTPITLSATASDTDGAIAKVDFYADNQFIGSDTTEPYSITWSGMVVGNHTVSSIATDNETAYTQSKPVTISITTNTSNIPTTPSNLRATTASKFKINLSWTDTSSNETGFKIERSTNLTTWQEIAAVGTNTQFYSNSGLKSKTMYYYRVRAYNNSGYSAYSSTVSARTF